MKIGYLNSILQRISIKKACQGYYLRWYYNGWHYWFFLPGKILRVTEGENYRTIGTRKISMGSGQITYEQINALRTIRNSREIQLLTTIGWLNIRLEPGSVIVANNYINGYEFDFIAIIGSREGYYSPVTDVPDNPSNPSKYIYGFVGIYITHHAVTFTMILTGTGDITVYWGDGTNNTYTLTDIPLVITHTYTDGVTEHTIGIDGEENIIILDASGNHITEIIIPPTATSLTTLILADNELTETPYIPDTVPLIYLVLTGNPLTICEVVIGSQIWMCKNYDSDFPGSKVYDDIEANRLVYGGLYSWNQINNPGFCPLFWHVPTLTEWNDLITYLLGSLIAGGKLKEVGYTHWNPAVPPTPGTDDYIPFTVLPSGYHDVMQGYIGIGYYTKLWALTPHPVYEVAYAMQIAYNTLAIANYYEDKLNFCPVRLLKKFLYIVPYHIYYDWFLPSYDEIQKMYDELTLFGVGDLSLNWRWCSSEFDATKAYYFDFENNVYGNINKIGNDLICRAIRSFTGAPGDYSMRDTGPAGGLIFLYSGGLYYECSLTDLGISDHYHWSNIALLVGTATAIGTGQANTTAIIAQAGHVGSAAKLCNDLVIVN